MNTQNSGNPKVRRKSWIAITIVGTILITYLAVITFPIKMVFLFGPSEEGIVYVTATGKKYHEKNCVHLTNTSRAINLDEAADQGYDACKVCKPPQISPFDVQISANEKRYHRSNCRDLEKPSYRINLSGAKDLGYTPCNTCNPPK